MRARGHGRDDEGGGARPRRAPRGRGARPDRRERRVPVRLQRRRRHDELRVAGRARARGRRCRRGGRREGHARQARRPRHALLDAVVRGVLGVPPRPAAAVLDDLAADGCGRSLRRDLTALAGRPRRVYHYCFLSTFAEATVVPERACVPIPKDVPFDVASLVGCAVTTGVGAVWNTAGVRPGDRVAIIGCGGVGLSALMAAVAVGAEPVIAVDATQAKVDTALSFGASAGVVWAGSAEATAEAVREASGGGVDYAIEATGRGEAMLAAVLSTRTRGAAVLIGIPRADTVVPLPALTDPAHGAAGARLDLRLGAPGARLRQDPGRVPLGASSARPARLAPTPARASGRRLRR